MTRNTFIKFTNAVKTVLKEGKIPTSAKIRFVESLARQVKSKRFVTEESSQSGNGLPDDVMDDIIAIMDEVDFSNISSPGPDGIDGVHFSDDDVDGATTVYAYATKETYDEMQQLVKRFAAKVRRLPEIGSVTVKRDTEPQTGNIRFNIVIKL